MPHYTRDNIRNKNYTVYFNGKKVPIKDVIEVDTDNDWLLIYRQDSTWTSIKTVKVYGRVHLVIEEKEECSKDCLNDCSCEHNCDDCDSDSCNGDDGYYCSSSPKKSSGCGGCGGCKK